MNNIPKRDKILAIIQKYADNEVDERATMDSLGIDSLSVIEILLDLEDEFNINIPETDQTQFYNVKDILDFVEKIIEGGA